MAKMYQIRMNPHLMNKAGTPPVESHKLVIDNLFVRAYRV